MKNLIKKLILFLIRKRLKVEKYEFFKFDNQLSENAVYFFGDDGLMKTWWTKGSAMRDGAIKSTASLNWLLDDECKIDKYVEDFTGSQISTRKGITSSQINTRKD